MKFDKSRIYTAVNADEVKIGSKGYFEDSLAGLEAAVINENKECFSMVFGVISCDETYRFYPGNHKGKFALFYLVEEPKPESKPEIKEVTAAEWDNKPRIMKVWNDNPENTTNTKVIYILANADYPVITVGAVEISATAYKHCAEIEATPKENEASEKSYRPYKDTDEMIEDFKRRCEPYGGWRGKSNPMYCPLVWVKDKYNGCMYLIKGFEGDGVFINISWNLKELFSRFTYLDGSPVGAEI